MLALNRIDFVGQAAGKFSNTRMLPPEKWMDTLRGLMEGYQKKGNVRSVDALLVTLCQGDAEAALMLKHVMEWQPRAIREDGAIWRSAEEWMQYTGLTKSKVYNPQRRERLKAAGLKVWVEKAWGENTMHFRIDAAKLTANISAALGMNYNIALIKLWQIVPIDVPKAKDPIPFPQAGFANAKAGLSYSQIPLTESLTEHLTDKTTSVLLNSFSFSDLEKKKYGVLDAAVVEQIVSEMEVKKAANKLRKNPLAYLRYELNRVLKELTTSPAAESSTPPLTPPRIQGEEATQNPSPNPSIDVPRWWMAAKNQLIAQLKKTVPLISSIDFGNEDGDTVVVSYPKGTALWILQRYQRNIERMVGDAREMKTTVVFQEAG
jgi:hypothetical protein